MEELRVLVLLQPCGGNSEEGGGKEGGSMPQTAWFQQVGRSTTWPSSAHRSTALGSLNWLISQLSSWAGKSLKAPLMRMLPLGCSSMSASTSIVENYAGASL